MKRNLPEKIKFFLTRHRNDLPLNLHAFLIRHGWVENRGLEFAANYDLNDSISKSVYVDEAIAHAKERIRNEIWGVVLDCLKHNFYPEYIECEMVDDFVDNKHTRVNMRAVFLYRKTISFKEMRLHIDKLAKF